MSSGGGASGGGKGGGGGGSSTIQTFLRIKPSKSPSNYFLPDDLEPELLAVNLPETYRGGDQYVHTAKLKHSFRFSGILDATSDQEKVFKKVGQEAVKNALEGFNSTIFAYGQTGSGKTFTLTGGPERYADRGLIPRALSMLFSEFRSRTDVQYRAYVSYLEIYNEQGYDLLDPSQETKALEDLPKVTMLEDERGNFHLKNLSMHPAESEEDALNLLFLGDTNRAIAETPMNLASSRSHCIFSISLEMRQPGSDRIRRSKLHLVDLAGSERVSKTHSSGSVLTEAKYINSSLFFLEMVIVALYEKATKGRTHIPYRNSMMTSVLRDSLGGNCKTIMIATINPESIHTEESLSTCRFAQRVSLIKNRASINEETDPSQLIRRLKTEILALREEISFLKGESGEGETLSPAELEELRETVVAYANDGDPQSLLHFGELNLTKIKTVFTILKGLYVEACRGGGGGGGKLLYEGEAAKGGVGAGGAGGEDLEKLNNQIRDLKSLLLQRDSEINILVNMVKKGKTVEDVDHVRRSTSTDSSNVSGLTTMEDESFAAAAAAAKKMKSRQPIPPSMRDPDAERKQREEKLVRRHLFGVPPPTDTSIFEDAAASFEWFRSKCSLNQSLNENKELLKEKIAQAKLAGERGNQSRNTIAYLKNSIEAIRRERALQNNGEEEKEGESPEETTYRRAIEQEKAVYKESCDSLKVLKPEIEHVRRLLEKCRLQMQSQFDQWFANLHTRGGQALMAGMEGKDTTPIPPESPISPSPAAESKDNGVNEDLQAFYQAKDELWRRRSNQS